MFFWKIFASYYNILLLKPTIYEKYFICSVSKLAKSRGMGFLWRKFRIYEKVWGESACDVAHGTLPHILHTFHHDLHLPSQIPVYNSILNHSGYLPSLNCYLNRSLKWFLRRKVIGICVKILNKSLNKQASPLWQSVASHIAFRGLRHKSTRTQTLRVVTFSEVRCTFELE